MDGIYSAAREVAEASLFAEALLLAGREITLQLSSKHRQYAERAVKTARRVDTATASASRNGRSSIFSAGLLQPRHIPVVSFISSACGRSRNLKTLRTRTDWMSQGCSWIVFWERQSLV